MTAKLHSLLALAEEDPLVAGQATTPARPAAYHIAQAIEKAARAICEHAGIAVGPTHNIGQIGALLPAGHPMREMIEAQNYHSSAATRFLYPDPAGRLPQPLPPDEIARRLADARAFLNETYRHLGLRP